MGRTEVFSGLRGDNCWVDVCSGSGSRSEEDEQEKRKVLNVTTITVHTNTTHLRVKDIKGKIYEAIRHVEANSHNQI